MRRLSCQESPAHLHRFFSDRQPTPTPGCDRRGRHEHHHRGVLVDITVQRRRAAAVPGGTIQRFEHDAEGSPYKAPVTKADGSQVTVKVDASFKVTSIESGPR